MFGTPPSLKWQNAAFCHCSGDFYPGRQFQLVYPDRGRPPGIAHSRKNKQSRCESICVRLKPAAVCTLYLFIYFRPICTLFFFLPRVTPPVDKAACRMADQPSGFRSDLTLSLSHKLPRKSEVDKSRSGVSLAAPVKGSCECECVQQRDNQRALCARNITSNVVVSSHGKLNIQANKRQITSTSISDCIL